MIHRLNLHKLKNISINNLAAVLTVSFVLFFGIYFYCEHFLEPKAYDFLTRITTQKQASKDIIEVVIDDQSINMIGRWPWDRNYYADMFEYLENHACVKAIAFDSVILSYNPGNSDKRFFSRVSRLKKVIFGIFFSKQANYFNNNDKNPEKLLKERFSISVNDKRAANSVQDSNYKSSSFMLKELLSSVSGAGSVLSHPDNDGIIRKIEHIYQYKGSYYPSLALKVYLMNGGGNTLTFSENKITDIAALKIPVFSTGNGSYSYIRWYQPISSETLTSHKSYNAWKVIKSFDDIKNHRKPLLNPEEFRNKIVVIGATATALKDFKATSMGGDHPGVDIQATVIDNVIHNDFVIKANRWINIAILITVLALSFALIILLQPLYSSILLMLLMLGYFELCVLSYRNNFAIDIVAPQAFIICSLALGYGYKYFLENTKKRQIQKVMAKYVSKDVMTNILHNVEDVKLGGKRAEVTILFADIRGFTSLAETLEPEEVSSLLNEYFSEMVPIILKNNGMLDKFMGDAILAVFGAPVENHDHPMNAIRCAIEMLEKAKFIQDKWTTEGKPRMDIGIGINTGIVFVGNIGSEDRLEYTVVGDTVNLANRLESFNKLFNTKLLISSSTYEKVKKHVDVIHIHSVEIKGKVEPVSIYEVISFIK